MAQKNPRTSREVIEGLESEISNIAFARFNMGHMHGIDYGVQTDERKILIQTVIEDCNQLTSDLNEMQKTVINLMAKKVVLKMILEKQEEVKRKKETKELDAIGLTLDMETIVSEVVTDQYNTAKTSKKNSEMTDEDCSIMIKSITEMFFKMNDNFYEDQFQRRLITAAIRKKVFELFTKNWQEKKDVN